MSLLHFFFYNIYRHPVKDETTDIDNGGNNAIIETFKDFEHFCKVNIFRVQGIIQTYHIQRTWLWILVLLHNIICIYMFKSILCIYILYMYKLNIPHIFKNRFWLNVINVIYKFDLRKSRSITHLFILRVLIIVIRNKFISNMKKYN